jgi:outer membrane protein assembly factor BamB
MRVRLLFVVLVAALGLGGCDWAQFGFDATHSGFNPNEPDLTVDTVTHLTPAWHRDVGVHPIAADGHVYVVADQTSSEDLYAVDPATGAQQWHDTLGGPSSAVFNVVAANSTLYFLLANFSPLQTSLHAYDAATGALKWATDRTAGHAECKVGDAPAPVTIGSGIVVFTAFTADTQTSAVCAFDASTGVFQWSRQFVGESYSGTQAIANDRVYAASDDFSHGPETHLRALNVTNGATVWGHTVSGTTADDTVVAGSRVLVAGGAKLATFDAVSGTPGWTSAGATAIAASNDRVVAVGPSSVRALDLSDGAERWSIVGPSAVSYRKPAIAGGVVYVGSQQELANDAGECCAHIDILRLDSGGRLASLSTATGANPPSAIVSGGTIYVDANGVTADRP